MSEQECQAALAAATAEARELEASLAAAEAEAQELGAAIAAEREEAEALQAQLGDLEGKTAQQVRPGRASVKSKHACVPASRDEGGLSGVPTCQAWSYSLSTPGAKLGLAVQGKEVEANARFLTTAEW